MPVSPDILPGMNEIDLLLYGLLVGLLAGSLGGLLAGLCGLGGGLIYVPVFLAALPADGIDTSLPVFASMVAIIATSALSCRAHWRLGHVRRRFLLLLAPGLAAGACAGLWFTLHAPDMLILLMLAILNAWVAFDYGKPIRPDSTGNTAGWWSFPIGYLSGTLGIGGGTMLVPLLRRTIPLRQAVGTTTACTLIMAVIAVVLNLASEPHWLPLLQKHLPWLTGAWAGILLALPAATRWSAALHRHLPEALLRTGLKIFFNSLALLLLLTALRQLVAA